MSEISIESVSLSRPGRSAEEEVQISGGMMFASGHANSPFTLSGFANIRVPMRPIVDCQTETAQQSQNDQHFGNIRRAHELISCTNYSPPAPVKEGIRIKISDIEKSTVPPNSAAPERSTPRAVPVRSRKRSPASCPPTCFRPPPRSAESVRRPGA